MATNQQLSVFISSHTPELTNERNVVQAALAEYTGYGWLRQIEAGIQPEPAYNPLLAEVAASDVYIGLLWLTYNQYVIEELEYARKNQKPCLIYEKSLSVERRNSELTTFLKRIQLVDNPDGLTICRFETSEQLAKLVQRDVIRLLLTRFRESRRQPPPQPTWNSATSGAKSKGIAISTIYGNINQYRYAQPSNELICRPLPPDAP